MENDNDYEYGDVIHLLNGSVDNYYAANYSYSDYNYSYYEYDHELLDDFQNKWQFIYRINFVAVAIICSLGVVFNSITVAVVLCTKTLLKTRAGQYLLALAIADCVYLIFGFIRMLNEPDTGWNLPNNYLTTSNALCVAVKIINFTGKIASAWLTVAIATDRLLSIKFPFKGILKNTTCTWITIGVIFLLSLGLNLSYIAVFGVTEKGNCTRLEGYDIVNWVVHRTFSLILPATLLFILTSLTIYYLWRAKQVRMRLGSVRSSQSVTSRNLSTEGRLTWMLMAVSIAFLVLRVPAMLAYEVYANRPTLTLANLNPATLQHHHNLHTTYYMLDIFDTLNYAINFFLYCICGKVFRTALVAMMTCQKNRRRSGNFQYVASQKNKSEMQSTQMTISSGYLLSHESSCV